MAQEIKANIDGEDDTTHVLIEGYLLRNYEKATRENSLKYFILIEDDTNLRYYEENPDEKAIEPTGMVPLQYVIKCDTYVDLKSTRPYGFTLHTIKQSYRLGCNTTSERDAWVVVITQQLDKNMDTWGSIHINVRDLLSFHQEKKRKTPKIKLQGSLKIRGTQAGWKDRVFVLVDPGYVFLFKNQDTTKQFLSMKITNENYDKADCIRGLSSLPSGCCPVTEQPRDMREMENFKNEQFVMTIKMANSKRFYFAFESPASRTKLHGAIKTTIEDNSNKDKGIVNRFFSWLGVAQDSDDDEEDVLDWSSSTSHNPTLGRNLSRQLSKIITDVPADFYEAPVLEGFDKSQFESTLGRTLSTNLQDLGNRSEEKESKHEMEEDEEIRSYKPQDASLFISTGEDESFEYIADDMLIWRVEDFRIEMWPSDQYGKFNKGDVYLVLSKVENDEALGTRSVHLWIGSRSHICEQATGAMKAAEVAKYVESKARHFREEEGEESEEFLHIFDESECKFEIIDDDGCETAIEKVLSPEEIFGEPQLLRIKGTKQNIAVHEVNFVNSGDVFIWDRFHRVTLWTGKDSNSWERAKGLSLANELYRSRITGHSKDVELCCIYEGAEYPPTDEEEFWGSLKTESQLPKPDVGQDAQSLSAEMGGDDKYGDNLMKVYEWSYHKDEGKCSYVKFKQDRELERKMLREDCVYILDCGTEMFVWQGRYSGRRYIPGLQDKAVDHAQQLLNRIQRFDFTELVTMNQFGETPFFKAKFHLWEGWTFLVKEDTEKLSEQTHAVQKISLDFDMKDVHENRSEKLFNTLKEVPCSGADVVSEPKNKKSEKHYPQKYLERLQTEAKEQGDVTVDREIDNEEVLVFMDDGYSLVQVEANGVFEVDKSYVIIDLYTVPHEYTVENEPFHKDYEEIKSISFEQCEKALECQLKSNEVKSTVYFWKGVDVPMIDFMLFRYECEHFVKKKVLDKSKRPVSEVVFVQQNRECRSFLGLFEAGIIISRDEHSINSEPLEDGSQHIHGQTLTYSTSLYPTESGTSFGFLDTFNKTDTETFDINRIDTGRTDSERLSIIRTNSTDTELLRTNTDRSDIRGLGLMSTPMNTTSAPLKPFGKSNLNVKTSSGFLGGSQLPILERKFFGADDFGEADHTMIEETSAQSQYSITLSPEPSDNPSMDSDDLFMTQGQSEPVYGLPEMQSMMPYASAPIPQIERLREPLSVGSALLSPQYFFAMTPRYSTKSHLSKKKRRRKHSTDFDFHYRTRSVSVSADPRPKAAHTPFKKQKRSFPRHSSQLYHIKGTTADNVRALQVECTSMSLNSGDAFVLCSPEKVFAWYGRFCSETERNMCDGVVDSLAGDLECVKIQEGSETEEFWGFFMGKSRNYCRALATQSAMFKNNPRMFKCSLKYAALSVEELPVWGQEDLNEYSSLVLDNTIMIYVWFGQFVGSDERRLVEAFAEKYLETCPQGRSKNTCKIEVIKQRHEPLTFKSCFHGWDYEFYHDFADPFVPITQNHERLAIHGRVVSRHESEEAQPETSE